MPNRQPMRFGAVFVTCLCLVASVSIFPKPAVAADPQAEVLAEVERIEDMRILVFYSLQDLHGDRALVEYLKGFGGPDRMYEVEDLIKEGLWVYENVKAVDYSGTALQVIVDHLQGKGVEQALPIVQQARAMAARTLMDYRERVNALTKELHDQVIAQAKTKGISWDVKSDPMPWPEGDPRELDRARGLTFGWTMPLDWSAPDSPYAKIAAIQKNATLPYILAKAKRQGIGFISVGDSSLTAWDRIEAIEGQYDFAALDAGVAQVKAAGLKVVLRLHSLDAPPPNWLMLRVGPEASLVNAQGKPIAFRGAKDAPGSINLFNPDVREPYLKFLRAYGTHVKEKWGDVVMAVYVGGEELEIATGDFTATGDFSSFALKHWRLWLIAKYHTPQALNAAWGTPEVTFNQAVLAAIADVPDDFTKLRPKDAPANAISGSHQKWSDWLAWREDWLSEYIKVQRDALVAVMGPGIPVQSRTINEDMHRMFNEPFAPVEGKNLQLLSQIGAANPGTGTTAPGSYEVLRSFADGRWLWHYFMPVGCGAKTGSVSFESLFHDVSVLTYNMGPEGSNRFLFPAGWFSYPDKQLGTFGIGSYFITPREMQKLSPTVLSTERAPAKVAILWSQSSLHRDGTQQARIEAISLSHLLQRTFIPFEFVTETDVKTGVLKDYKLLILPATRYTPKDVNATITAWVEGGGTLMGFASSGLENVFGAGIDHTIAPRGVEPDKLFTGHSEGPFLSEPPAPYLNETNLTAILKVTSAKPRAWYFGSDRKDIAITENTFGQGKAILCGYPLGNEYYQANPYEVYFGAAHVRTAGGYTDEQVQKEKWIIAEMTKLGIERPLYMKSAEVLRAQNRDDADWFHIYQHGPSYEEYQWETDAHVHSFIANVRTRKGVDDARYLCVMNTEMNYLLERGYTNAFVSAAKVVVHATGPATKVVADVALGVPVPFAQQGNDIEFTTWAPLAEGKVFAVSSGPQVRLFGEPQMTGVQAKELEERVAKYVDGTLDAIVVIDQPAIQAYMKGLQGKPILIACGKPEYIPAAKSLAKALKDKLNIDAKITQASTRMWLRKAYQDSWGYNQMRPEEADAQILIGNTVENGLMYRFEWHWARDRSWLPICVNEVFPGAGHSIVELSLPVTTTGSGVPEGRPADQKLILGATNPADAERGAQWLTEHLP